jgi:hypothetical protein
MSWVYKWIPLVVVRGLWVAVSECQEAMQEGEAAKDATALGAEYGALRRQRTHTAADTERLTALEADLGVARQACEQFLAHVQADLRQAPQPSDTIHRLAEESQGLMDALRELDPGTVALHTLVSETAYFAPGMERPRFCSSAMATI